MTEIDFSKFSYLDYKKMKIDELMKITEKSLIPAMRRLAAREIYERGESEYAVNFLIAQMNRSADPTVSVNEKLENCYYATLDLARLKDKRAINPLFEILGEVSSFADSYALSRINGPEVEERLLQLYNLENKKGIHAAVALGFMKNNNVIPMLIHLLENSKEYEKKLQSKVSLDLLDTYVLEILGTYKDNKLVEDAFRRFLTEKNIQFILMRFLAQEEHPTYAIYPEIMSWEIVKNYGWDKYIVNKDIRNAFIYPDSGKMSENLRNETIEKIWQEIKGSE